MTIEIAFERALMFEELEKFKNELRKPNFDEDILYERAWLLAEQAMQLAGMLAQRK